MILHVRCTKFNKIILLRNGWRSGAKTVIIIIIIYVLIIPTVHYIKTVKTQMYRYARSVVIIIIIIILPYKRRNENTVTYCILVRLPFRPRFRLCYYNIMYEMLTTQSGNDDRHSIRNSFTLEISDCLCAIPNVIIARLYVY